MTIAPTVVSVVNLVTDAVTWLAPTSMIITVWLSPDASAVVVSNLTSVAACRQVYCAASATWAGITACSGRPAIAQASETACFCCGPK